MTQTTKFTGVNLVATRHGTLSHSDSMITLREKSWYETEIIAGLRQCISKVKL